MGERYTNALKEFEATIAQNVTENLFDRHLKRGLFRRLSFAGWQSKRTRLPVVFIVEMWNSTPKPINPYIHSLPQSRVHETFSPTRRPRIPFTCPSPNPTLHCPALMKSEHRHDLKTNDLAKSLLTFQDYAREYGGRVILGLVIVILAIVLIMQRTGNSGATQAKARDDLAYVRNQIDRLNHVRVFEDGHPSVRPAEVDSVRKLLQEIRDKASDKSVLAAATVAWATTPGPWRTTLTYPPPPPRRH